MEAELDDLVNRVWRRQDHPKPPDFGRYRSAETPSGQLHDIKIQLFALGLIDQSKRRRAVSDSNTYWSLTQAGREQLMRLRAIRRPASEEASELELAESQSGETPADATE